MDIEMILQKFAVFSGLAGAELRACLPYCHDAMDELTARRRSALPAAEPLGSAAAALAYYRWCLAQMSGSKPARCRGGGAGEPYDPCGGKGAV